MLRTKITELGKLTLEDDGGLVCTVTSDEPPPLSPSAISASFCWASPDPSELTIGDLVVHRGHGVARYGGSKSFSQSGEERDYMILEFAEYTKLYVPYGRSDVVQKSGNVACKLSSLGQKSGKWSQSYCIEALPNAYHWPDVGPFPEFPAEPRHTEKMRRLERINQGVKYGNDQQQVEAQFCDEVAEWRSACAAYRTALHANPSYLQAAREYFERQNIEPIPLLNWWAYRSVVLRMGSIEPANSRNRDELVLLIKQYVLRRDRNIERIRREVETLENCGRFESVSREPIPEEVRLFVWRRDNGQCVRCGSRERLEFDHIIPVIAGGSNTERNIQLLCESCNRSKGATV